MYIHFKHILSLHRAYVHGKMVFLKFISNLGWNIGHLTLFFLKKYTSQSTFQRDHDVLSFIVFGDVLREQLRWENLSGADAGNVRLGL